ncbi:hypothetical protein [Deinococcus marmoris]|uniref:hypothetical protein n=1 Tax=Deinococcus marmoris TaxID=249408 RepID=UPI0012DCCCA1|nr:hypothetical protein [Deinococcus marmoris]
MNENFQWGGTVYWAELYDVVNNGEEPEVGYLEIKTNLRNRVLNCIFYPAREIYNISIDEWELNLVRSSDLYKIKLIIDRLMQKSSDEIEFNEWMSDLSQLISKAIYLRKDIYISL